LSTFKSQILFEDTERGGVPQSSSAALPVVAAAGTGRITVADAKSLPAKPEPWRRTLDSKFQPNNGESALLGPKSKLGSLNGNLTHSWPLCLKIKASNLAAPRTKFSASSVV